MGLLSFERKYFFPLADVIAVPLGAKKNKQETMLPNSA